LEAPVFYSKNISKLNKLSEDLKGIYSEDSIYFRLKEFFLAFQKFK
jgi:hypothetical protein